MNFMDFDWLYYTKEFFCEDAGMTFITLICCIVMTFWHFWGDHSNDEKEDGIPFVPRTILGVHLIVFFIYAQATDADWGWLICQQISIMIVFAFIVLGIWVLVDSISWRKIGQQAEAEEKERQERIKREQEEKERQERIKREQEEKERQERMKREREEKERQVREQKERLERIKREREEKKRLEREKEEKERQERIKREKEEKERQERMKREQEEKEEREKKARRKRLKEERDRYAGLPENTKDNDKRIQNTDKSILQLFLQNPFRILGLSCKAAKADALAVKDKIEKLARLNITQSYKTEYDLKNLSLPSRELSVLQSSMMEMDELKYRWFWFESNTYCKIWEAEYNLVELEEKADDSKAVSASDYDLFLACYLRALLYGDMEELDTVMHYMNEKLFSMSDSTLAKFLRKRLPAEVSCSDKEIINSFKEAVLSPIIRMFEAGDEKRMSDFLDEDCMADEENLKFFTESLYTSMAHWVDGVFEDLHKYVGEVGSKNPTEEQRNQIVSRLAKIEGQMPLVKGCIDYASDYGAFSDRMKKKTVNTVWDATIILNSGGSDKKALALKYDKMIYPYCSKDNKRILRNAYGYKKLGVSENELEPDEMNSLGVKYATGDGVPVDEKTAVYWYRKAAKAGDSHAQSNLGDRYYYGNRLLPWIMLRRKNGIKDLPIKGMHMECLD